MPSRIVEIRRRKNMTRLPDDVYEEAKRRIGSTLTSSGDIRTGLTLSEEKELMPYVLGVSESNVNFHKEVKEFFKTLTVDVPSKGVKLEAGLDEKGLPITLMDYVKYKYAISHPDVLTEEEVEAGMNHKFYIFDKAKQLVKEHAASALRKEAMKEYIKLTGDAKRMDMVLRVLSVNPEMLDEKEKEPRLEKESMKDPGEFVRICKDRNLETISFIKDCISKGVLRKEGNSIFNADEVIGATQDEAVVFLQDKKNSDVMVTLNARLKALK